VEAHNCHLLYLGMPCVMSGHISLVQTRYMITTNQGFLEVDDIILLQKGSVIVRKNV
jgi:hypothetical protein